MSNHEYNISVFSPEGRLYQVEYSFQAIKQSNLNSIGIKNKNAVVLIYQKPAIDKYQEPEVMINQITKTIFSANVGLKADCKHVVSRLRNISSDYKFENQENIQADVLSMKLANVCQNYTQSAFQRPFGCETILVQNIPRKGPMLYKVDPSGFYCGYHACASGIKEQEAIGFLEKQQYQNMDSSQLIQTSIKGLMHIMNQQLLGNDFDLLIIDENNQKLLTLEEKERILQSME